MAVATEIKSFRLTPPQTKIFLSKKKNVMVNAGRRFGKTWFSGARIMDKCCNHDHKTVIYVAPTNDMARDLMWDTWIKEHIPQEYIAHSNEQRMVMTFLNGSRFMCCSADNADRLAGKKADLLIVDECALIKNGEEFYNILKPIVADKYVDGETLFISTPRGYNWFYDLFCKARENPLLWDTFEFTTLEGGNVLPERIEEDRKTMSPKMFAQEYLASFESVDNRIYYAYDRHDNACELDEDWGKGGDIHVGIDFNVNPMTAAIAVWERGSLYFFDEIVEKGSNTQELSNTLKKRYPKCTIFVYPDPTGNKQQANAPIGVTDMKILRENGFIVCAPPRPYPSKDKWNSVNTAMLNAKGEHHVFVAREKCPQLKKAWEGYSFKENENPDKSSGLDHISDAAAYLITFRLPAFSTRTRKPKILGV